MKSYPKIAAKISSKELWDAIVKIAVKAGFTTSFSNYSSIYPVMYVNYNCRHKLEFDRSIAGEVEEVTVEQLIEYLLNDNITWDTVKKEELTVGGNKVTIFSDGTVKFGCTLATKEEVNQIIAIRKKLLR
jgi:hypothetical protein